MNAYQEKIEARKARYAARAEKLRAQGQGQIARAEQIASFIPLGQPILVGHHSEGRHRSDLKKIQGGFERGFQAMEQAERLETKAENYGSGAISSDDPEAVSKLQAKLAGLEEKQAVMKGMNAKARKAKEAAPVPAYMLSNNNAEIGRYKARIAQLQAKAQEVSKEVEAAGGVKLVENVEDNRLQLIFPGKPEAAIIAELKGQGFRWAPSAGAWQRQLNNGARWAAECVLAKVAAQDGGEA